MKKKDTHPSYQEVLFVDSATGSKFVCGSTIQAKEKGEFEGKTYPMVRLSTSSASHPFFTGASQFVDSEGRIDKFKKRYAAPLPQQAAPAKEVPAEGVKKKKEAPKETAKKKKSS